MARARTVHVALLAGYLYFLPVARSQVGSPNSPVLSIQEAFAAYNAGDFDVVRRQVNTQADFQRLCAKGGFTNNFWRRTQPTFLLDVAAAGSVLGLRSPEVLACLDRAEDQLLQGPAPDSFDKLWYLAALALVEDQVLPDDIDRFLGRIQRRLRSIDVHPRFLLARGIAREQRTTSLQLHRELGQRPSTLVIDRLTLDAVVAQFGAAKVAPDNLAECLVRQAFLRFRGGLYQEAKALLDEFGEKTPDKEVLYWSRLFSARTMEALGQYEEAERAYLKALETVPGAQSPLLGLAFVLFRQNQQERAMEYAAAVRRADSASWDPWWHYWQGDGRFLQAWLKELRLASTSK